LNDFQKHTASSKKSLIYFKSATWFIRKKMTVVNSRPKRRYKGVVKPFLAWYCHLWKKGKRH
jgi:hypothetical protein